MKKDGRVKKDYFFAFEFFIFYVLNELLGRDFFLGIYGM